MINIIGLSGEKETAKSYIQDYLYGVAEKMIVEKYQDTISEAESDLMTENEYTSLIEWMKNNL